MKPKARSAVEAGYSAYAGGGMARWRLTMIGRFGLDCAAKKYGAI
jgi:hypothetical protein